MVYEFLIDSFEERLVPKHIKETYRFEDFRFPLERFSCWRFKILNFD